jgi:preprotein translocase subunit SecF
MKGGPRYGIDFRGGIEIQVRFTDTPQEEKIRTALAAKIPGEITVQRVIGINEVLIATELKDEKTLDDSRRAMVETLRTAFGQPGKLDFNNAQSEALASALRDPLQKASVALSQQQLDDLVRAMLNYRNTPPRSGLVKSLDELSAVPGVTPQILDVMKQAAYASSYAIRDVSVVGPKIGAELQSKAVLATLYALGGMLVYIGFRFQWIYGVGAVLAVFFNTFVTIGLFSIFDKEISLTVVAAMLTLVGYSMNDTVVVFDRIRENLRLVRRESLERLINHSLNQTLSRTVLTGGLTFVMSILLLLFGGETLNGFAFALVSGIIVGTYSSVFIASPVIVLWHNFREGRKAVVTPVVAKETSRRGAVKAK